MSREGAELPTVAYDAYCGSMDAALSLFEAVLPGWWFTVTNGHGPAYSQVGLPGVGVHTGLTENTPSRALLIAILEALVALESDE